MKKIWILLTAAAIVSCNSTNDNNNGADSLNQAATMALQVSNAERDSLLILFNDVTADLLEIKQLEQIVSVPGAVSEDGRSKSGLRDDIMALKATLQQRRQRIEELEAKLKSQSGKNSALQQMIDNLLSQISSNEATINDLTNQLSMANATIANLNITVDSLNDYATNERITREQVQQQNEDLINEMNRCYYALGSDKELKNHRILDGGFLKKSKIMKSDYELSYFTQADRRSLSEIPLHSKKAKVLTYHPQGSYSISEDASGIKTLNILDPAKFWQNTNFLVVKTN